MTPTATCIETSSSRGRNIANSRRKAEGPHHNTLSQSGPPPCCDTDPSVCHFPSVSECVCVSGRIHCFTWNNGPFDVSHRSFVPITNEGPIGLRTADRREHEVQGRCGSLPPSPPLPHSSPPLTSWPAALKATLLSPVIVLRPAELHCWAGTAGSWSAYLVSCGPAHGAAWLIRSASALARALISAVAAKRGTPFYIQSQQCVSSVRKIIQRPSQASSIVRG